MDDPRDAIITEAFQALERTVQAPPNFYQQISARVAQHQPRRWFHFGSSPQLAGAWGLALATCLLVSLSFNILWGSGLIGPRTTEPPQLYEPVPVAHFQSQIQRDQGLGAYVLSNSILAAHDDSLGLVALPPPVLRFRVGTGYTEVLALLSSEQSEPAIERLQGMIEALDNISAPAVLVTYLRDILVLARSREHPNPMLARLLTHFETLYEVAYLAEADRSAVTLFRTGAWLENMDLATQTSDQAMLRQGPASAYYRRALQSLGVQPELLTMLERIEHLVSQPTLSDQDVATVGTLVRHLQHRLSN